MANRMHRRRRQTVRGSRRFQHRPSRPMYVGYVLMPAVCLALAWAIANVR
jgi:hypothetical protein